MPKQDFKNGVLSITEDINNPQDKLKIKQKQNKGKKKNDLTVQDKADLFDAYVDAGIITL